MLNTLQIYELIRNKTNAVASFQEEGPTPSIYVRADFILEVLKFLREEPELHFEVLMNQTAFHETEDAKLFWHLSFEISEDHEEAHTHEEIRIFYHLFSYKNNHRVIIESSVPIGIPQIDSAVSIWKGANWQEREIYDLLGVEFIGHPDLRRIMLPEDWEGFPLRKNYINPLVYQDIDNSPSEITKSFNPKGK